MVVGDLKDYYGGVKIDIARTTFRVAFGILQDRAQAHAVCHEVAKCRQSGCPDEARAAAVTFSLARRGRRSRRTRALRARRPQTRIGSALQALCSVERALIVLRDVEGLSYRQIGESLGWTVASVESRLWLARRTLQHELVK